jgi:ribosomal protein S18 acetylase RimI-like enzyme
MELDPTSEFPNALPPGWKIRPHRGTVADDLEWLRLDHEGYSEDDDAQWPSEDDLAERRRQRGFRFWFLEREGAAVGFLHATETRRAHVHSLVVSRDHRGRALGYALMVHAIHALRADGAIDFTLHVRADNAPAVRLYEGLGFEAVEGTETWQRITP